MRIAPIDIVNKRFGRAFRGLSPAEVADFQTDIAATLEALLSENSQLREHLESLREQLGKYTRIEETLQNTLLLAQKASEEARGAAKQEAELTVREAQQRAQDLMEHAQSREREVEAEIARLRRERERFEAEFGAMLQGYMNWLRPGASDGSAGAPPPTFS